jgi:hypothetical protein
MVTAGPVRAIAALYIDARYNKPSFGISDMRQPKTTRLLLPLMLLCATALLAQQRAKNDSFPGRRRRHPDSTPPAFTATN